MSAYCVLTTINPPTKAIEKLYEKFGSNLIVVGDEKTPEGWNYKDAKYILDLPKEKWYEGYAPRNSYARKNLGYLEAMKKGATVIYSSDDDNIPNANWAERNFKTLSYTSDQRGWYNVYTMFSDERIWPRGFSLQHLNFDETCGDNFTKTEILNSSIQQGLADKEPDVDAIWRLTDGYFPGFKDEGSIYLNKESWCPINSQSTWFFKKAFPLMYLPVYCNMRCTDIWGGFVAQRCIWELGEGVTFHSPSEVYQDRNPHDLLKDFEDEIPGYLHNDTIVKTLEALTLKPGEENVCDNMLTCYQAIVDKGILPEMEIRSLKLWIKDYEAIIANMGGIK